MGCACLFGLLAAGAPRLALVLMWLITDWVQRAFDDNLLVPLLGLIFLPLTTCIYVLVSPGGMSILEWMLMAIGFLIDLGAYGGGLFGRRK